MVRCTVVVIVAFVVVWTLILPQVDLPDAVVSSGTNISGFVSGRTGAISAVQTLPNQVGEAFAPEGFTSVWQATTPGHSEPHNVLNQIVTLRC